MLEVVFTEVYQLKRLPKQPLTCIIPQFMPYSYQVLRSKYKCIWFKYKYLSSSRLITVKPVFFTCPLFCESMSTAVISRAIFTCPGRAGPVFRLDPKLRAAKITGFTVRIEYKLLSLTYKVLTTAQPSYLHNLISLQPPHSTRSSSVVTLSRPPTISSFKITDRSFRYASPRFWNQLPKTR